MVLTHVGTVEKYLYRALGKLGASDRTQAAVDAIRRGLLSQRSWPCDHAHRRQV
jgi:hypothetical protein